MLACAFTGHRHIKCEHLNKLSDMLSRAIDYAYSHGCRRFLTGGALGFDTEAAREVLRFRLAHPDVSLSLILPCENQCEHWLRRQIENYDYILASANEVIYISDKYTSTCMKARNRTLAEQADIIIAYVSRTNSGAAQTVRMAEAMGKQVYNIYPALDSAVL